MRATCAKRGLGFLRVCALSCLVFLLYHCYTFTVQYNLDTLPSERLVRASFVHLRSSPEQAVQPPRCRAQITALGAESLVTLEPHERWTETDITAHISSHVLRGKDRGRGRHLTLTAQYWCTEPELAEESNGLLRWWRILSRGRTRWIGEPHLEVPSLLLYLEEERENAPTSSSSFSTPTSSLIVSDIPSYKHKTNTPKNRCKLHSFRLSFDELGWGHYFIAPPVYNPRFCQGDCPRVLHYGYHSPNHAIIQTLINDLGVGDVPPPSLYTNISVRPCL
uniref:Bone morphogenetic protein 15-like n=1 Tax=Pundamilia nyererei TaxID=303518 RepID=A0A3B4GR66_9CICH